MHKDKFSIADNMRQLQLETVRAADIGLHRARSTQKINSWIGLGLTAAAAVYAGCWVSKISRQYPDTPEFTRKAPHFVWTFMAGGFLVASLVKYGRLRGACEDFRNSFDDMLLNLSDAYQTVETQGKTTEIFDLDGISGASVMPSTVSLRTNTLSKVDMDSGNIIPIKVDAGEVLYRQFTIVGNEPALYVYDLNRNYLCALSDGKADIRSFERLAKKAGEDFPDVHNFDLSAALVVAMAEEMLLKCKKHGLPKIIIGRVDIKNEKRFETLEEISTGQLEALLAPFRHKEAAIAAAV